MTKKIKLLQITHDLAIGGLQQVVVNLCRSIDREKFDVSVLCLRYLGEFVPQIEELGIKVIFLPQREDGRTDHFAFLKVAKVLEDEKIDIIHTHNTQPFFDGTLAAILKRVKAVIHTDHCRAFPDKKRYMFAEWLVSHYASKVVGVSDHTSENLVKYEHISRKKIVTIPNGIDETIYEIDVNRDAKKKELGIERDGFIIGLGVRLSKQKGITYLIKAMPAIINEFPEITLVIAGDGSEKDNLVKEAEKLGVLDHMIFTGPRLDVSELLKLFDLYVLPSIFEGLPMVLLEAMAAGCPIVATDVGGNSTAITHRDNGSLVKSEDPDAFATEVVAVLKDEILRKQYVSKSHKLMKEKFSASIMAKEYEKLYLEALNLD